MRENVEGESWIQITTTAALGLRCEFSNGRLSNGKAVFFLSRQTGSFQA
jgi:hypothetical protein